MKLEDYIKLLPDLFKRVIRLEKDGGSQVTVGNGTITMTQGGVSKGSFTTNQSGNTTIEIDAGGGGADLMVEITHSDLLVLVNTNSLVAGQQYRITDYVATVDTDVYNPVNIGFYARSNNHAFDIIVTADSTNKLNENARAIRHEGDTYFPSNTRFEAWKLKYTIFNDSERFNWVLSSGKGVIYQLIDEFNNDIPYDFKSIQFQRNDAWVYTFGGTTDNSLSVNNCYSNKMKPATSFINRNARTLNNNIFGYDCYSNTFGDNCSSNFFAGYNNGNIFGDNCSSNFFAGNCNSNIFGNNCYSNTLGENCYGNTFRYNCNSNAFGYACSSNNFGDDCYDNTFGNNCSSNAFVKKCYSNNFGGDFQSNTLGDTCNGNTFGNYCNGNTFGDYFQSNTLGNTCYSNIFGYACNGNTFGETYANYNISSLISGINFISKIGVFTTAPNGNVVNVIKTPNGVTFSQVINATTTEAFDVAI